VVIMGMEGIIIKYIPDEKAGLKNNTLSTPTR
jgi:hypothetical protein